MFKNLLKKSNLSLKLEENVYNGLGVYSLDSGFGIKLYVISDGVDFWDGAFFTSPESALDCICAYEDFYDDFDFVNYLRSISGTFDFGFLSLNSYINKKNTGKK